MSKFGDLLRGKKVEAAAPAAPTPPAAPAAPTPPAAVPAPSKPAVNISNDMTKVELEEYGRTIGIELDRRHSKQRLIQELEDHESNS